MAYAHVNFPALEARHIAGASLFATRADMVISLGAQRGGVLAELGVALGDFSELMIEKLQPLKFVAIDLFDMHETPVIWGKPASELFQNMSQLDFYTKRFSKYGSKVVIDRGPSFDVLEKYPDRTFDLIYIDAGHDYESVKRDGEVATRKIKSDGVIIFNDYVLYDPFGEGPYGVVQAVNELVVTGAWQVAGFALEKNMFCDIALKQVARR